VAWIEERTDHVRVIWREGGRGTGREYEKFATRDEAEIYKRLVEAAGNRRPVTDAEDGRPPRPIPGLACTVERWADFWLSGLSGIRDRTAADYGRDIRRHVLPVLGASELTAVAPTDVGVWIRGLQDRGLSPKTIRNLHGILFTLMQAATEHEPAPMRPATHVRRPGCRRSSRRRCTSSHTPSSSA
jgi:hypothetical protein